MGKKSNAKKVKREKIKEESEKTILETPVKASQSQEPQMRQIVIETDGNNIKISRNETSGNLELLAVLQALIGSLTSPKQ